MEEPSSSGSWSAFLMLIFGVMFPYPTSNGTNQRATEDPPRALIALASG
jgi:hypothetical protein